MKKILAWILTVILTVGLLGGCVAGKTAVLFVEDTQTDQAKLIWAGFSAAAKKMGMKPVLSGLTEESSLAYTVFQIWEQDIAEHEPDVMAVVGLSDSDMYSIFLDQQEIPVVAIDPIEFSRMHEYFCVYSASDEDLSRMAAQNIIGMQLPTSGRIRLLYNKEDVIVRDTFVGMLESAGYNNFETTPLSGRITDQSLLNNFSEDTVGIYNASDYDTDAEDLSNLILADVTTAHLASIQNDQASSILCRNEYTVGDQAARACGSALRKKDVTAVTVDPILVTKSGPDQNGIAFWLDLLN